MLDRTTLTDDEKEFLSNPLPIQNILLYRKLEEIINKTSNPVMIETPTDPEIIALKDKIQIAIADKQKEELQKSLDTLTAPTVIDSETL